METAPTHLPASTVRGPSLSVPVSFRVVALLAALLSVANALWAAWDQDVTYDEPFHLRWAERLLRDREDGREEFRFDSKTPAMIPAIGLRKAAIAMGAESDQALRFATRLPSVALLIAAFFLVARLAETQDPRTWWIGLLIAALDPNLAAHASIATTDLAYTVVVLLLAVMLAGSRATVARAVGLGLTLGLAFAVKFTAVLLPPIAIAVILIGDRAELRHRIASLMTVSLAAFLAMDLAYLWVGVMEQLKNVPFQTPMLKTLASFLPTLRLPVPRGVLTGIDVSMAHNRADLWASYVFGTDHRGGVWYYFIVHWLMKTPIALIALIATGFWGVRRWIAQRDIAIPATVLVIHLVYLSFFFATQIGLRFALPCVALACAIAARGLGGIATRWILVVAALCAVERIPYREDPIAFTNLTVWPKSRAYWFMADSNLDYGQNRARVAGYARDLGQAFVMDQATVTPGLYVAGANELTIFDTRDSHRWLLNKNIPAINVGFTDFAFSITGERFDEYLNETRMAAALPSGDGKCAEPLQHYAPGARIPFDQRTGPGAGRLWIVCVSSRKGADIGFTTTNGRLWFGRVTEAGSCEADLLQTGQQAWFRIPRGGKTRLCLREIPYRRSEVAYVTTGYVTIRGQGADVELREAPHESLVLNAPEPASQK
ncbi:MAG: hypothetical protein ABI672_01730 [Vicinamibacteria bacterium]